MHTYAKALAMDPDRLDDVERQRRATRELRATLPNKGGDLDDESDEAVEMLVDIRQR
jgi:hypothetical protein